METQAEVGGHHRLIVYSLALILSIIQARAVTFTSDTLIRFNNSNYDGADIVITNCTVTIDGRHSFNSVRIQYGGILTHSNALNGLLDNPFTVTNEQHVLMGTNLSSLNYTGVLTSVGVADASGLVTYSNGVDYVIGYPPINGAAGIARTSTSAIPDGAT